MQYFEPVDFQNEFAQGQGAVEAKRFLGGWDQSTKNARSSRSCARSKNHELKITTFSIYRETA
jgi:hypothetical protein